MAMEPEAAKLIRVMLAKVLLVVVVIIGAVAFFMVAGPEALIGNAGKTPATSAERPRNATPDNGQAGHSDIMDIYTEMDAGLALPELRFVDEAGRDVRLSDFRGRVVLLNVWATWCAPCVVEMPTLDALQGAYGGDDFEVVALSFDRGGIEAVIGFYEETEINHLRVYADQFKDAQNELMWGGLPMTILIDREGREIGRVPGPADWFSEDARKLIEDAMNDGKG